MIPFRNIITAHQTKEVNGLYKFDMELPLFFRNNKGQFFNHKKNIDNAVFIGHFDDADKFQLYKIHARIVSNDNLIVSAVHIFFDEALAMDVIRDKRPTSIDAKTASEIAFGSTGWRVAGYDTTDLKSTNFYYITPVEARKKIIETWNVEFDYGLAFDGQKIISKDLYIKKRLGSWTGKRFAYGSNLLSITDEQNEAEVLTAVIGRGKGEEVGDGYGRRIDFADIVWSKDGITKQAGKDYIEIPSATSKYGYYDETTQSMKARIGVIVFDDIEDQTELANASYNWLLQNCVPKSVMQTTVAKIGGVKLGDDIGIIYQEVEIAKMARVQKMVIDLIDEHKSEITIGDYQYFKEDKATANLKRDVAQVKNEAEHYITQLKNEFDTGFETQTQIIDGKIAQVVEDAEADVLASETKMREEMAVMKRETDATMSQFNNNLLNYDTRINEIDGLVDKAVADASTAMNLSKQASDNLITTQQSLDAVKADVIKNSGDIASVKNSVAGQSAEISNLNNQIKLTATKTEVADAVGNIQIGGTNLVRNARFEYPIQPREFLQTIDLSPIIESHPLGTKFSISFDLKSADTSNNNVIHVYCQNGSASEYSIGSHPFQVTTEYQRFKIEGVTPEIQTASETKSLLAFYGTYNTGNFPIVRNIKVETGTKATDFSESPEDFNARITKNEADIVIANDAITQRVTKTEYDTKTNQMQSQINTAVSTADRNTQTIAVLQGDIDNVEAWQLQKGSVIDQTASAITNKVWNTDINNATNTLTTKINTVQSTADSNKASITTIQQNVSNLQTWQTQKGSVIDQTASAITNKVWQSDINAVELGTRNWFVNSTAQLNKVMVWTTGALNPESYSVVSDFIPTQANEKFLCNYSTSQLMYFDANNQFLDIGGAKSGGNVFTIHNDSRIKYIKISFRNNFLSAGTLADKKVMLVKGTKIGQWLPAPEDAENRMTEIQSTADAVKIQADAISKDYVKQSAVITTADGIQIGSKVIKGDTLASVISVTPSNVDIITRVMRVTGDMQVAGDIKSLSLSAVYADIAKLRANIITADSISATALKVDLSMINKLFAQDAYVSALTSKSAFIRDINAISVTTNSVLINSVKGELGKPNSGLNITRPDGATWIENGIGRNEMVVTGCFPRFTSSSESAGSPTDGATVFPIAEWFVTNRTMLGSDYARIDALYFNHDYRYLVLPFAVRVNKVGVYVKVEEFGTSTGATPFTAFKLFTTSSHGGGGTKYDSFVIDLGTPTFKRRQFYLYMKPNLEGSASDLAYARFLPFKLNG